MGMRRNVADLSRKTIGFGVYWFKKGGRGGGDSRARAKEVFFPAAKSRRRRIGRMKDFISSGHPSTDPPSQM
jgi:hypothetical protein